MRLQHLRVVLLAVALLATISLSRAAPQPAFGSGQPQSANVSFQLAVYFLTPLKQDPLAGLRADVARLSPGLAVVATLAKAPQGMQMHARVERDVKANYPVPDLAALRYFGRGLSAAQSGALQSSTVALILDFAHPKKYSAQALREAYALAEQVALRTGGLVWDEETREVFTPALWNTRRIASWTEGLPDVEKHISIHSYMKGGQLRAITLGMLKFGMPDLVVDQFANASSSSMTSLLNLTAQTLVEGAAIGSRGALGLDIKAIKNSAVRSRYLTALEQKATGVARFALVEARADEGDPRNRLAEIDFAQQRGPDLGARQVTLLSGLFGSSDNLKHVRHDRELTAASELARKQLPLLQADLARGLKPGEYILVKAPFATAQGGTEWMWVEVRAWKGKVIEGSLNNEPFNVPELRSGQKVTVSQDRVFDYLRRFPDGTQEGNTTSAIILKMQGTVEK